MKKINNPDLPSLEEFRGKNLANVLGDKYAETMLEIFLNFSFKENEWVAPDFNEISQAISEKLTTDVSYDDLVDGWIFLEENGYVKNDPCVDHNYVIQLKKFIKSLMFSRKNLSMSTVNFDSMVLFF